jgi:hypothetical protein
MLNINCLQRAIERMTLIKLAHTVPTGSKITWADSGYIFERYMTTETARAHFVNCVCEATYPCFIDVDINE